MNVENGNTNSNNSVNINANEKNVSVGRRIGKFFVELFKGTNTAKRGKTKSLSNRSGRSRTPGSQTMSESELVGKLRQKGATSQEIGSLRKTLSFRDPIKSFFGLTKKMIPLEALLGWYADPSHPLNELEVPLPLDFPQGPIDDLDNHFLRHAWILVREIVRARGERNELTNAIVAREGNVVNANSPEAQKIIELLKLEGVYAKKARTLLSFFDLLFGHISLPTLIDKMITAIEKMPTTGESESARKVKELIAIANHVSLLAENSQNEQAIPAAIEELREIEAEFYFEAFELAANDPNFSPSNLEELLSHFGSAMVEAICRDSAMNSMQGLWVEAMRNCLEKYKSVANDPTRTADAERELSKMHVMTNQSVAMANQIASQVQNVAPNSVKTLLETVADFCLDAYTLGLHNPALSEVNLENLRLKLETAEDQLANTDLNLVQDWGYRAFLRWRDEFKPSADNPNCSMANLKATLSGLKMLARKPVDLNKTHEEMWEESVWSNMFKICFAKCRSIIDSPSFSMADVRSGLSILQTTTQELLAASPHPKNKESADKAWNEILGKIKAKCDYYRNNNPSNPYNVELAAALAETAAKSVEKLSPLEAVELYRLAENCWRHLGSFYWGAANTRRIQGNQAPAHRGTIDELEMSLKEANVRAAAAMEAAGKIQASLSSMK